MFWVDLCVPELLGGVEDLLHILIRIFGLFGTRTALTLLESLEKNCQAVHPIKVLLAIDVEQTQELADANSVGLVQLPLGEMLAQEAFGALVVLVDHLEVVLRLDQIGRLLELRVAQVFELLLLLDCGSGVPLIADLVVEPHHDLQHLLHVFHVVANTHLDHPFDEIING